jgi:hypothetical protein
MVAELIERAQRDVSVASSMLEQQTDEPRHFVAVDYWRRAHRTPPNRSAQSRRITARNGV